MRRLFALTCEPQKATRAYAKKAKLQAHGDLAKTFSLVMEESDKSYYNYNEYPPGEESLGITGDLSCAIAIAHQMLATKGCNFVRCGWVLGAAVVTPTQISVVEFESGSSDALAREEVRGEYQEQGYTEEEILDILRQVDDGEYHEFSDEENEREVYTRYALQAVWQDVAVEVGGCPDVERLRKEPLFSAYFDLGFSVFPVDSSAYAETTTHLDRLHR